VSLIFSWQALGGGFCGVPVGERNRKSWVCAGAI
jgi:hypothetical protein